MLQYSAKNAQEQELARQPCLRVHWKPDIRWLDGRDEKPLETFVISFIKDLQATNAELGDNERLAVVGALIDLAGHRSPSMHVLDLDDGCGCKGTMYKALLNDGTGFPRYGSWDAGKMDEQGGLALEAGVQGPFDLVIVTKRNRSKEYWEKAAGTLISVLTHQGAIIFHDTGIARAALAGLDFTTVAAPKQMALAKRLMCREAYPLRDKRVVIVARKAIPGTVNFGGALKTYLQLNSGSADVEEVAIDDIESAPLGKEAVCISLLELEREFLASMNQHDMDRLRCITNEVASLLWLTGSDMLGHNPNPSLTLASGLSRALALEQPSLRFMVMDVGPVSLLEACGASACEDVARVLELYADADADADDKEFIKKDGLLYISRFGPDFELSALFRRRLGMQGALQRTPLSIARPARLAIGQVGVSDTIHFQQVDAPQARLPAGFIDVLVRAVSLNAKDVYALRGRVETHGATTTLEFSGLVTEVGSGVTHLQAGDRVVVLAPSSFTTTERVPAWAAHKMLPQEPYTIMASLPVAFATALYALRERAGLRAGESVLIHGGSGAVGMAAIAIAQRMGAVVYTTAGTPEKRSFLAAELGVPESNIFHSRDASFVDGVGAATAGRGVDVVVNSFVGDLMHASWACTAPFGRFVEIGKRELVDAGRLDMHVFLRNATFTAFDLSDLFSHQDEYHRNMLRGLTEESLKLYRSEAIKPAPIRVFPASEIIQAHRYFSSKERVGKIVISLEDDDDLITTAPSKYLSSFDPEKVYLLVGCLGGLGRSLARWLFSRGARRFVFLGRSGCDKPRAHDFVSRLEQAGASVAVVRGDVTEPSHAAAALEACQSTGRLIGGVVQGAMALQEGLFSNMTSQAWLTAIKPKWVGTWNLHTVLEGQDEGLDFFLLMSSVSGSVGTATESNYCSANGFLDAFARWRRARGKPGVSVGIGMVSEVGYLHENPEIEALLLRKGIQPLSEVEFLQVIDLALEGPSRHDATGRDSSSAAHLLTGLEPLAIHRFMDQGFDVHHGIMEDPRTAILLRALDFGRRAREEKSIGRRAGARQVATAVWFNGLPTKAARSLASEADAPSLEAAILQLVRKRFSIVLLMPLDQIDDNKPLAGFGMDSMIASEFRSWLWTAFKVDVPFLELLTATNTLGALAAFIGERLLEG